MPAIGAPVAAIVLGAVAAAALGRTRPRMLQACAPGLTLASRTLLQLAIVTMGFAFPIGAVATAGARSMPVLITTLAAAAVGAVVLGRMLALHSESALLVGVGTAICGASAIAAVTAVVRPAAHRVGYAVATIFIFNVVAVLVYPPLGRLLHLSPEEFGMWAGSAINDTSSVLAASTAFGAAAVPFAVVVKLVRSLAIVPLCVGLHIGLGRRQAAGASAWRTFPWFIVAFVATSIVAATGVLPSAALAGFSSAAAFLVTVALAAVGTSLTPDSLRTAGTRPIVFGGLLALLLAVTGLTVVLLSCRA